VNEQKSKPTQQSVQLLRERGLRPDMIIGRCSEELTPEIRKKISLFCDVEEEAVITGIDVDNIYKIPIVFEQQGLTEIVQEELGVKIPPNHRDWKRLLNNLEHPDEEVTIAICGKYTSLDDSYASILEALSHCSAHCKTAVNVEMAETTDREALYASLDEADGVIVPGGFGTRGIEGKIDAIRYCRENDVPYLGICYGMQLAVVEYARHVCGLSEAHTTEVDEDTPDPVIDFLPEQKDIEAKGGTMRLGAYPAVLEDNSVARALYDASEVSERHRHRYEVNPNYHDTLRNHGLVFSGMSPDGRLVEFAELPDHSYFIGTQAHPELKSKLEAPAPLFLGLVKAALGEELDEVEAIQVEH
jgi:CTP synthase